MNRALLTAVAFALAFTVHGTAEAVIGGRTVAPAANPAIVRLMGCTASLIGPRRILTAAHCAGTMLPTVSHLTIAGRRYRVMRVAHDPRYHNVQHHYSSTIPYAPPYDVAIAELDRPVTGVTPLALYPGHVKPGRAGRAIGFGIDHLGGGFGTLHAASIVVRSDARCHKALARASVPQSRLYRPGAMICAQDPDGRAPYRSACNGDSGSPLLISEHGRSEVAGVDSWGVACGTRHNDPEVFMTIPSVLSFVTSAAPAWEPEPVGRPRITGTPAVGSTLTCAAPAWAGSPPPQVHVDWITARGGAGGATYVVRPQDAGGKVRCRIEASVAGGGTLYFPSASVAIAA
jgi:hypothetical protein